MIAKPRVLHVYKDYFPPVVGGVESTINLLARGTRDEFDTSVIVCSGSSETLEEEIDGVRVMRVGEQRRFASAPLSLQFPKYLQRLARDTDILHFHHPNPSGDLAFLLSGVRRPYVMTYHSDIVRQRWAFAAFAPLQNWMMKNCGCVMPTSPDYLESSSWLCRYRAKCTVVPLGIELSDFTETPGISERAKQLRAGHGERLIVFVGKLRYYKGLQFLVDAMTQIDARLVIVGSGKLQGQLKRQAIALGVEDKIHFAGEVPQNEKVAWLYAATVFCMPSHLRSEAFGISQIEAMACGLPVVSCNIPTGVRFVNRDGETGLLVEPQNPGALAKALNRLLSDDNLRNRLGTAAQARAHDQFSSLAMCARVRVVYREVLRAVRGEASNPACNSGFK